MQAHAGKEQKRMASSIRAAAGKTCSTASKQISSIDTSPRQLAQASRLASLFGRSVQLKEAPVQLAALVSGKLNVAGENHEESKGRRIREAQFAQNKIGSANYWTEGQFTLSDKSKKPADPYELRYEQILKFGLTLPIKELADQGKSGYLDYLKYGDISPIQAVEGALKNFYADDLEHHAEKIEFLGSLHVRAIWIAGLCRVLKHQCQLARKLTEECTQQSTTGNTTDISKLEGLIGGSKPLNAALSEIVEALTELNKALIKADNDFNLSARDISAERSDAMHASGQARAKEPGLWKVGDEHATDMALKDQRSYNLLSKDEFNSALKDWVG